MAHTPTLSIAVYGSGCPTCKRLHVQAQEAVKELGLNTEVLYSTDIEKIMELGLMSSPVLVVNGKPVIVGSVPSPAKIRELIQEGLSATSSSAAQ